MMRQTLCALALAGIAIVTPAIAEPVAPPNVPSMVAAADLIVVGRAMLPNMQASGTLEIVAVAVDRVLKGTVGGSKRVTIRLNRPQPSFGGIAAQQYAIFLLRAAGADISVPANPLHPTLPASPAEKKGPLLSRDALRAVASELVGVLETPGATLVNPGSGVHDLVVGTPAFQAGNVYLAAVEALRTIPYQIAGAPLRAIAASNDAPGRLWAINCLMTMGSSDQIEALKVRYLNEIQPLLLKPSPETAFAVSMLANAIEGHLKSPEAVPTLATLLGSDEVAVRRVAASVLSDIATPAVIAPLAKTALADPDEDVRYYAVLGLAEATGAREPPTMPAFKEDESKYVGYWRGWAATNLR
jgi:hypothetical protein